MEWNLAQDLPGPIFPGVKLRLAPPLAGVVVDVTTPTDPLGLASNLPLNSVYDVTEDPVLNRASPRTDVTLLINITSGGSETDPDHPALPAPAFRVHAVCGGALRVVPAQGTTPAQLVINNTLFPLISIANVSWWQRWVETNPSSIPDKIIYENVDLASLRTLLEGIPGTARGAHGLLFPFIRQGVVVPAPARQQLIDDFFAGTAFIDVLPSATLGAALPRTGGNPGERQLRMKVRYANDRPMNPRELFNLMFGEKSVIALGHPLFQALNRIPTGSTVPKSFHFVMRPPLRTWRRLIWEAEQAADNDAARIAAGDQPEWGSLACPWINRFDVGFTHPTAGGTLRYTGDVADDNKCNLFTSEMCVRAGFKVMIFTLDTGNYHYPDASSHANIARRTLQRSAALGDTRIPIEGMGADRGRRFGYVLTRLFTNSTAATKASVIAEVTRMMEVEGRAIVVPGARRRSPVDETAPFPATCGKRLFKSYGHIVLLEELLDFDLLTPNPDVAAPGLPGGAASKAILRMTLKTSMTHSSSVGGPVGGAFAHENFVPQLVQGAPANDGNAFIRIHVFEAAPGLDPDLRSGVRDLHVINTNLNTFGLVLERAVKEAHLSATGRCCRDGFPGNPTEVACTS
jgi:hypothetical protein